MKTVTVSIMAGLVALSTLEANANWQQTKWGMTEAEVLRTAGPGAKRSSATICEVDLHPTKREGRFYVAMPYTAGALAFDGCLNGDAKDGLQSVFLTMQKPTVHDSIDLRQALERKYGHTFRETHFRTGAVSDTYEWHAEGNMVILTSIIFQSGAVIENVLYTPLADKSSRGL